MSAATKIEWCDHSLSPWWGCTKVSPGCAHCYAEVLDARWHGGAHWGKGAPRLRQENFHRNAMALERRAARLGRRQTVFPSMCDPFDPEVPPAWLADFLGTIHASQHLTWLLLTKRPQCWRAQLEIIEGMASEANPVHGFVRGWLAGRTSANVWVGTSVEDQPRADERIPLLLQIPAKVRFLSCEPLLGELDLMDYMAQMYGGFSRIDWVICGGESGPRSRPMRLEWARSMRDQCGLVDVPFFFKQWGEYAPTPDVEGCMYRAGKIKAGRLLDGREWSEFPRDIH